MGLFDKKYCDICGEKIGLLGNRKLEDGNLCKDCARKLSPWFSDRRRSTVDEIKEQLAWREANRERAAQFRTTRAFGERTKLLLDENHRWFAVTQAVSPADNNSDVLDFDVITGCRTDIDESRTELKIESRDQDGKVTSRSYNPPRYDYDYDFYIIISVNVPYFNEMKFKLNDSSVHIPFQPSGMRSPVNSFSPNRSEEPMYDSCYRAYRESCDEICRMLNQFRTGMGHGAQAGAGMVYGAQAGAGMVYGAQAGAGMVYGAQADAGMRNGVQRGAAPVQNSACLQSWTCPYCGRVNQGKFCENCGAQKP